MVRQKLEEVILHAYVPLDSNDIIKSLHLFRGVVVPVMTIEHSSEDGRSGAVLELRSTQNSTRLHIRGGTAPEDKFLGYGDNAQTKNDVFVDHPSFVASWQVHLGDTSQKPYPGGIRTPLDDRIAISGFTWQRDTIGCLWIAQKIERMSYVQALEIANMCGIRGEFIELMEKMDVAYTMLTVV